MSLELSPLSRTINSNLLMSRWPLETDGSGFKDSPHSAWSSLRPFQPLKCNAAILCFLRFTLALLVNIIEISQSSVFKMIFWALEGRGSHRMSSAYSQSFLQKWICFLPTFPQTFAKPLLCVRSWAQCQEEEAVGGKGGLYRAAPLLWSSGWWGVQAGTPHLKEKNVW